MSDEAGPLALVVGGGSGIGAAVAAAHRATQARVVVWDVAGEHDVTCDVTDAGAIDAAVRQTRAGWGVPTTVTVTAGIGHSGMLADTDADAFDRVMAVNARGPWLCLRAWLDAVRDEGRPASFVATSSISARVADRSMGMYCASKAALSMLVRVAALEWADLGIRVNAVAPGVTRTPMLGRGPAVSVEGSPWLAHVAERTALGRLGEPDDVATVVLGLHAMPWVTGQVLECDGGLALHSPIDAYGAMTRTSPAAPI